MLFGFVELREFVDYRAVPSLAQRRLLVLEMLSFYDGRLEIYFKDRPSYEYRYLIDYLGERRGIPPGDIVLYEPWQPVNSAALVVDGDRLVRR